MSFLADRLQQAGIVPRHFNQSQQRLPCPSCDDWPRKGPREALALKIDTYGATWNCHRCGFHGGAGFGSNIIFEPGLNPKPKPERTNTDYVNTVWSATKQI